MGRWRSGNASCSSRNDGPWFEPKSIPLIFHFLTEFDILRSIGTDLIQKRYNQFCTQVNPILCFHLQRFFVTQGQRNVQHCRWNIKLRTMPYYGIGTPYPSAPPPLYLSHLTHVVQLRYA